MKNFFWIKDVPVNAILVENLKILSNIASELHHDGDCDYFLMQSKMVADAMRILMLDDNLYYSTQGQDYQKIDVITWHIFSPLFAGVATQDQAKIVVKKYFENSKEFQLPYLLPTVPKSEPSFDPEGFWRGPVWISVNWFVYQGLKKYGFNSHAKQVLESSLKLLEKSGFREYFNPINGKGLGANNFTWGGLAIDME